MSILIIISISSRLAEETSDSGEAEVPFTIDPRYWPRLRTKPLLGGQYDMPRAVPPPKCLQRNRSGSFPTPWSLTKPELLRSGLSSTFDSFSWQLGSNSYFRRPLVQGENHFLLQLSKLSRQATLGDVVTGLTAISSGMEIATRPSHDVVGSINAFLAVTLKLSWFTLVEDSTASSNYVYVPSWKLHPPREPASSTKSCLHLRQRFSAMAPIAVGLSWYGGSPMWTPAASRSLRWAISAKTRFALRNIPTFSLLSVLQIRKMASRSSCWLSLRMFESTSHCCCCWWMSMVIRSHSIASVLKTKGGSDMMWWDCDSRRMPCGWMPCLDWMLCRWLGRWWRECSCSAAPYWCTAPTSFQKNQGTYEERDISRNNIVLCNLEEGVSWQAGVCVLRVGVRDQSKHDE